MAFRVNECSDRLTCNYNGAGDQVVTLTEALYTSLASLCAHIQTRLQALVSGTLTCTESAGRVTIAGGANFTVSWTRPSLMSWLGYAAGLGAASSYLAPLLSRGSFVAANGWADQSFGWEWTTRQLVGPHNQARALKLDRVRLWEVEAFLSMAELAQWRIVASYLIQGARARWWRDTAVVTAWDYRSSWNGYVDCALTPESRGYTDRWVSAPLLHRLTIPLAFVEVV